jgi:hypothetical protein
MLLLTTKARDDGSRLEAGTTKTAGLLALAMTVLDDWLFEKLRNASRFGLQHHRMALRTAVDAGLEVEFRWDRCCLTQIVRATREASPALSIHYAKNIRS